VPAFIVIRVPLGWTTVHGGLSSILMGVRRARSSSAFVDPPLQCPRPRAIVEETETTESGRT
jgi:hypothetical protein